MSCAAPRPTPHTPPGAGSRAPRTSPPTPRHPPARGGLSPPQPSRQSHGHNIYIRSQTAQITTFTRNWSNFYTDGVGSTSSVTLGIGGLSQSSHINSPFKYVDCAWICFTRSGSD